MQVDDDADVDGVHPPVRLPLEHEAADDGGPEGASDGILAQHYVFADPGGDDDTAGQGLGAGLDLGADVGQELGHHLGAEHAGHSGPLPMRLLMRRQRARKRHVKYVKQHRPRQPAAPPRWLWIMKTRN